MLGILGFYLTREVRQSLSLSSSQIGPYSRLVDPPKSFFRAPKTRDTHTLRRPPYSDTVARVFSSSRFLKLLLDLLKMLSGPPPNIRSRNFFTAPASLLEQYDVP